MWSVAVSRRILTLAAIAGICAAHMGRPQAVQLTMRPAAAAQIAAAIGSDADARTVMSMFLTETFPPSDRRRTEFLLRDQIRDEWLPKLQGVELVPLSEGDATARLTMCGTFLVLSAQKQSDGVVRVSRQAKCMASVYATDFAFRDRQWRPVASSIGSGWV
jgi:hypothetical protein